MLVTLNAPNEGALKKFVTDLNEAVLEVGGKGKWVKGKGEVGGGEVGEGEGKSGGGGEVGEGEGRSGGGKDG